MKRFRVIFMGTPDFAVPCLARLVEISDVIAVVTQPDKPKGRGQKLLPPPVKVFAQKHGIDVHQPIRVKSPDFVDVLRGLAPDLIVVVAFGQILSKEILSLPPLGCINVHASLLPRYRGAAPMQWAIVRGEKETGVTTMFMDEGLDTGDMLLREKLSITQTMTAAELHDEMMKLGADVLEKTLFSLSEGTLRRTPQDGKLSTYAPLLAKEMGRIDWQKSAQEIHDLVRGLNSWPGAYAVLDGKKFKIWCTRIAKGAAKPGEIISVTKQGLLVGTGAGMLEILELQAPNKKKMVASDYVRGHGIRLPARFDL